MRVLAVMALVAMVYSAPVQEDFVSKTAEGMVHNVAKRMDEQLFYGNQQNAPRVKKADPETDSRGLVRALPADEIKDEEPQEEPTILEEPKPVEVQEPYQEEPAIAMETSPEVAEASETQSEATEDKNTHVSDEEALKEDELLKAETAEEPAVDEFVPDEGGSGNVVEQASDEITYDDLQKLYNQAGDRMPYDYYYPEYYLNYRKKRNTALSTDDDSDVVKRNHRAKRGLGYDELEDSYFPSSFEEDQYYNNVMRKRAVEVALDEAMARELAPLLEKYQSEEEYPERYDVPSYLEYLPESEESFEQYPYDEDSWEPEDGYDSLRQEYDSSYRQPFRSQPTKRQFLSMVPGSRRKRLSYSPYSKLAGGHWGAIVDSEKRGQEAAYERLYRLARALATRRSPYASFWSEDVYEK